MIKLSYRKDIDNIKKDLSLIEKEKIDLETLKNYINEFNILQIQHIISLLLLKKYSNKRYKNRASFYKNSRKDFTKCKDDLAKVDISFCRMIYQIDLDYNNQVLRNLNIIE